VDVNINLATVIGLTEVLGIEGSAMKNKIIFKRDYHGFEDVVDLERDISECFDSRFNPEAKDIPNEFTGTVKVTIEYVPSEEN
jgi:hypothetical protein